MNSEHALIPEWATILNEFSKGCSQTFGRDPWDCEPCTRAAINALLRIDEPFLASMLDDELQKALEAQHPLGVAEAWTVY